MFIKIKGEPHYLWRAVDQDGDVIDILVQKKRDTQAAKRFFRKLLKKSGVSPNKIITDKLRSYGVAHLADIEALYNAEFLGMTNQQVSLDDLLATRDVMINIIIEMLTESDRNFLLSLKRSEPDWSLFPIKELQGNVSKLPAVRWKMMNLAKMSKKQRLESLLRLEQVLLR